MLYAGGIVLAALVGAAAIVAAAADVRVAEIDSGPRQSRWRRKSQLIAALQAELAATSAELEEHRQALAKLATQLTRESEAAEQHAQQLEHQIHELEAERNELHGLVAAERDRFEQTLDALSGGIGRTGNQLAELEREVDALITR
jgi:septal ring factor EnvC (AmiA/AmiB activator)